MHCRERWNDPVEENRNEEVLQDADETTAAQEQEPEITDEAVKEEIRQRKPRMRQTHLRQMELRKRAFSKRKKTRRIHR